MKASGKDIRRTIFRNKKRFCSILIITALGVMMLSGLKAACDDLRYSADQFYDAQQVFDIQIVSTMGLDEDDLAALRKADGIERAEGVYRETVYTSVKGSSQNTDVQTLGGQLNTPYLLKGRLPENEKEIAVSKTYADDSEKTIGDTIQFHESSQIKSTYTISAIVQDPSDLNNKDGAASFRSISASRYVCFIREDGISIPAYTAAYVQVKGSRDMASYSDEYEALIKRTKETLEQDVKQQQEDRRYDELVEQMKLAAYAIDPQAAAYVDTSSIEHPKWYIQDRSSLSSYSNIESDAASIEAVGTAFPIVFFTVAILIALTTITRMVEEERLLIGTYKALGFRNIEIMKKYLLYAGSACLLGGIIGDIGGFLLLPKFVFSIFQTLYLLPNYSLQFDAWYGIGGIALFTGGILIAVWIAVHGELKHMPAILMRPKAPRTGARVLLERIRPLWRNLTFLNKVTARNLFRYKKRMLMTVFGIMGCSALVLCAMAINDSVSALIPRQYEHIYRYDLMVMTDDEHVYQSLSRDDEVSECLALLVDNATIKSSGNKEERVQLMVFPEQADVASYLSLEDLNGDPVTLEMGDVYVTQNASQVLDFSLKDTIRVQNSDFKEKRVKVTGIVQNYLGNTIYMSKNTYKTLFGSYEDNAVLANFRGDISKQQKDSYVQKLEDREGVLSVVSTSSMQDAFETSFSLITSVVYLILAMAAALAFVVLFTLSTTNISERVRELATIKVLGFYDKEVHSYVNKETLLLTFLGILAGLPAGTILAQSLTYVLNMPSIHFAVTIRPISYLYTVILSFGFAVIVNLITNRVLNHIDMVESLKSME
ncbi:ABC transporter permease [[Clostridium] innocuum]|uniref:FtsX-like permease family protein n=1 Tax=Clostridium innocuum TaxID=1522 RepID=UPI001F59F780|nr:ABC transporter permease [[Clostridium] innocuum]MCI2998566.1 ABC transporter permease [[Clostridium] innocuum]MCR0210672.1 ABC transporter permease [[Clostridium] innocuum]MCR0256387.1 ABC transporter permease [[Clostridium] innocuum]MCR0426883.1 ABC transporter permease [[Clostridium] innocuum]MCR0441978.1 ABC transporter permease [[Clostridium] innocuum]